MPINKTLSLPNGAIGAFHAFKHLDFDAGGPLRLNVHCFPDEAAYLAAASPMWSLPIVMPADAAGVPLLASIEGWLIASPDSPLIGGTIAAADDGDLASAKARAWDRFKRRRDEEEFGGFTWDGSPFDSDPQAQSRIQGGAQLATLAMIAAQAFSVDWTLADNGVRTLAGGDMLAVGEAMGVHIMGAHATGRAVRDAVEAATTVEQVASVTWPTG